jgi:hypothetical protein
MQTSYQFRVIATFLALTLALWASSCSNDVTPFATYASADIAKGYSQSEYPAQKLLEKSRTLAVRYRTLAHGNERDTLRAELRDTVRATCFFHDTDPLNWGAVIEADKFAHPELAIEELLCAMNLLSPNEVVAIIRQQDRRTNPQALRIECHRLLWQIDEKEAYSRARNLMFREAPRANNTLRPNYLDHMLLAINSPLVDELLIAIAAEESMESRARSLAISAIANRNLSEASPILESIFDTEATNFLIRKESLMAILAIDETRGRSILQNKTPQSSSDYGLYIFMTELRTQYGIQQ